MLYVANWKAFLTHQQALDWLSKHAQTFKNKTTELIVCPDATILGQTRMLTLALGGQDCSSFTSGAHTGEITAATLAACGVRYCIVGHYERRVQFNETMETIAQKLDRLHENRIVPILCVTDAYTAEIDQLAQALQKQHAIIIAYEPVASISTGNVMDSNSIANTLTQIKKQCETLRISIPRVLYGGSVNSLNAPILKKILGLDGLLIGKASTDFQELKKIVE